MGWTFYHVDNVDRLHEVRKMCTWQDENRGAEVLDIALRGCVVYAAVHCWGPDEDYINAVIFLTRNDTKEYHNFGYKPMTENMNPYYYDCPLRILNLLTPTTNPYALEWRKKCREKRKAINAIERLKPGTRIRCKGKVLELCTVPYHCRTRRYWFVVNEETNIPTWTFYRESNIIDLGWEVIA